MNTQEMVVPHNYSVKFTYKAKKGSWPAMRGHILEGDVIIGTFERRAVVDGYIPDITYKFFSSQARGRFDDFADCISIAETIEALAF
jgi:hypothetical protein